MIFKEKSGLTFELNKKNFTANVTSSPLASGDVFIPSFLIYKSQKYIVKVIGKDSFKNNKLIRSVNFPEESEVNTIEADAFFGSTICEVNIPSSLTELNEGWCRYTKYLTIMTVSPKNNRFLQHQNQFLIGKSNPNSNNYDTIYYAPRDIREVFIPSYIKYINSYAFANCFFLSTINFASNSQLERIDKFAFYKSRVEQITIPDQVKSILNGAFYDCTHLRNINISKESQLRLIGEDAFYNSKIERLFIPPKLGTLKEGWCNHTKSLIDISVSEENDRFSLFDNNMLVSKTEVNSDKFDVLCFASRSIVDAVIPSNIKCICSFAFSNSEIQTIEFCEDSEIEIINKETFSYSKITEVQFPKSVKIIGEGAFLGCQFLNKIEFPENSELRIIDTKAFFNSSIQSLNIPSKFVEFRGSWCGLTPSLNKILISPNNRRFGLLNEKIVISKSETNEDDFDSIVFASRDIRKVVIPSNIKFICQFSFNRCKSIEKVEISRNSKLELIEHNAFSYSSIKSIYIPRHVTRIGRLAFGNCSLETIHFSKKSNLQYIAKEAFLKSRIKSISIPDTVTTINDYAFSGCHSLEAVNFSDDSELSIIGKYSFQYTNIKKIKIPKNVEKISEGLFNECRSLGSIAIDENSELKSICKSAFNFTSISSLFIPSKVKKLNDKWCINTQNLNKISVSSNNKYFKDIGGQIIIGKSDKNNDNYDILYFSTRNIKEVTIPSTIERIKSYSFDNCNIIFNIKIEDNSKLQTIEENAFSQAFFQFLDHLDIPTESKFYKIISKYIINNEFYISSEVKRIDGESIKNIENIKNIKISPENKYFKYINDQIIVGKSDLNNKDYDVLYFASREINEITIPSYIKKINSFSFHKCYNLSNIEFESNSQLEIIDKYSFAMTCIKTISIPDHVQIIDDNAFKHCQELEEINFSKESELKFIGAYAFHDVKLTKIIIPKNVESIYQNTFRNCDYLQNVEFAEGSKLKSIKSNAFIGTKIQKLNLPQYLEELDYDWNEFIQNPNEISISPKNDHFKLLDGKLLIGRTKYNNDYDTIYFAPPDIETVFIPSYIKRINKKVFSYCKKLQKIEFEENSKLEIIDEEAFSNSSITEISIPKSVKIIQRNAFECTQIEKIIIPSQITQICNETFYCSKIKQVEFENNSKLILINSSAFGKTQIENILIPSNVQCINKYALFNCEQLKRISFEKNSKIRSIDNSIYSNTAIETFLYPDNIEDINNRNNRGIFIYESALNSIEFTENSKITKIGDFLNNLTIKNLYIPPKVTVIDENAFIGAKRLINIKVSPNNKCFKDILNGQVLVGKSDLNNKEYDILYFASPEIKKITIPSYIKRINSNLFYNHDLENIEFESNSQLEIIGSFSFSKTHISQISIPKHVKIICKNAFSECSNLKTVSFSENSELKIIEEHSFYKTSIEKITIPNSVEHIYENAFSKNYNLKVFEIKEDSNLQSIGSFVFSKTQISQLYIPSKVNRLENGWCRFTINLNTIKVSPKNQCFIDIDGNYVFGKSDLNTCDDFDVLCFASRGIKQSFIPSNIKRIDSYAFSDCCHLQSLVFDNDSKLETIGIESFSFSSISFIKIPKSIKLIDKDAFSNCKSLNSLLFDENSIVSIQEYALANSSLRFIAFPKGFNELMIDPLSERNSINCVEFLSDDLIVIDQFFSFSFENVFLISFPNTNKINFVPYLSCSFLDLTFFTNPKARIKT